VRLLTGNGPQAIDQQTAELRSILTDRRPAQPGSRRKGEEPGSRATAAAFPAY
jgi:hypothetical protein